MKIVIVSPAYPYRGGIAGFTGQLFDELIKEHEVDVINYKRQYPAVFFPGKTQFEENIVEKRVTGERIIDSVNPFSWIKAGRLIKRKNPDLLILVHWMPFFGPCLGTISRAAGKDIKKISICHNIIPHENKPGDKVFTRWFLNSVDNYILLSKAVMNDLLSLKKNVNYSLLFHPVYNTYGELVKKEEARKEIDVTAKNVLLFFGLIRDYKGLDVLIRAAALLKVKLEFTLIVAGEFYSKKEKYISLAQNLKISDRIIFHDKYIPDEEVRYYFSASDVVVLPYKSATQSGIAGIAQNFNKPVIASDAGGLAEEIEGGVNGLLFEKGNHIELAEAIEKFYKEELEEPFTKNIRDESEKYSWKRFVAGMMELINKNQR